jgi:transposase
VEVEALASTEAEHGWTVLATTVGAELCSDTEVLEAYQAQHTTVAPGFRWIKTPAAISPGWLEKPERMAAVAMLTVLGLLGYTVIQRPVRLYLLRHDQQIPGNKGMPALPTATVVLTLFSPVMMAHLHKGRRAVYQMHGVHA